MNKRQGYSRLALIAVMGLMTGCETGPEIVEEKKDKEAKAGIGVLRIAPVSFYFAKHDEVQSDNGSGVEKFVDCPDNQVLAGWGGRVDGDGNFTDIKIGCRGVFPLSLGYGVQIYPNSSTPAEKYVQADEGYVVVGIGGVVNSENLARAVIKQCPWDQPTMTVKPGLCTYKSSDASTATEVFMDVHNLVDPTMRPWTVLTGAGATAGFEALKAVRATRGTLKTVPLNQHYLSGGELRYSFVVPPGGKNVTVSMYSMTAGDADLYVGIGFVPTLTNYTCRPYLSSSNESCYFQQSGTYHVLIHPYTPYYDVSLWASHTNN